MEAQDTDAQGAIAPDAEDAEITDPNLMDRYECRACGYIYEPLKGDDSSGIDAGVPFKEIYDSWKCPVCTAPKRRFNNIGPAGNPSGFKENLGYGFGVNVLTPGQKNILIFGSLLL
ncbi:MAG: rubredoxin, partial [Cyanothece sp. SIO2G6]|nr:rubredoxin [Cyanothece sp. SIO2G6]